MSIIEDYDRERAAWLIHRARHDNPKAAPWLVCLAAARSPARAGDDGCLAAIRSVAIKFPITLEV
jgi:hypothetical protein